MTTKPSATSAYTAPSAMPSWSSEKNFVMARSSFGSWSSSCSTTWCSCGVHPVDEVAELFGGPLATYLLGRGQRVGVREVDGEQLEGPDLLGVSQLKVHLGDGGLDHATDLGLLDEVLVRRELEVVLLGPCGDGLGLDADERGEVWAAIADHHRLANERRDLEQVLDVVG